MINEIKFRNWLILNKGISTIKALQLSEETQLPEELKSEECKKLELLYEVNELQINNEIISVKIPTILRKELNKISEENKIKVSQIVRSALFDFVESYRNFERRLENEKRNREEINRQSNIQKNSSKHKKD